MARTAHHAPSVGILFRDSDVASIFAEIFEAQGATVCFLTEGDKYQEDTRIVTEPHFLPSIPPSLYARCLVVGHREAVKNLPTLSLARPLTEESVENAIAALLEATPD